MMSRFDFFASTVHRIPATRPSMSGFFPTIIMLSRKGPEETIDIVRSLS